MVYYECARYGEALAQVALTPYCSEFERSGPRFTPERPTTMADAESISLEETNKIRISLGLKPLTDDKGPADTQEKEAEDNYAKRKEQAAKDRETRSHS